MSFTFTIEGIEELKSEWSSAQSQLDRDLDAASVAAANDGIEEAQRNHPYTDRTRNLTDNAHVEVGDVTMVWPEKYSGFVDKGTSRNKPYPFIPQATARAEKSLEIRATLAAEDCADRMNR